MNANARHVAFDWGGVFTVGTFDGRSTERMSASFERPLADVRAHYFDLVHHLEVGSWTLERFWDELSARLGVTAPYEVFRELYLGSVLRNEPMYDLLSRLPASVCVGLLSNNYPVVSDELRRDPAFARFDGLVFSNELGHKKPAPEAFAALAAEMNVPPETVVFVDDVEENIDAARRAGFAGLLYHHERHAEFEAALANWLEAGVGASQPSRSGT